MGFANNHGLSKSFSADNQVEEMEVTTSIEKSLTIIKDWMESNRLHMNTAKTDFIHFGSKAQLQKSATSSITVNGEKVEININ